MQTQSARAANVLRSRDSRMQASRELSRSATELARRNQTEQAIEAYQAAIELFPSEPDNYAQLAELLQQQGKLEQASKQLGTGLSYDPNAIALHLKKAEIYLLQKQPQLAMHHTDQVMKLERDNADCWRLRADAHLQLNQIEPAMAACFQALAISPDDEGVLERVCQIYFRQGRPMRAWSIVQKMSAQYTEENRPAKLRLLEAETLVQMDRNSDAIQTLQRWYQDGGGDDANCCNMLAWCLDRESNLRNGQRIPMDYMSPPQDPQPWMGPRLKTAQHDSVQLAGGQEPQGQSELQGSRIGTYLESDQPEWSDRSIWHQGQSSNGPTLQSNPMLWEQRPKFRPLQTPTNTQWR